MTILLTLPIIALNLIAIGLVARFRTRARMISICAAALSMVLAVIMIYQFAVSGNAATGIYIPYLNIGVSFGLSGISAVLLLMAEIVMLIAATSGNTERAGFAASAALLSLFQIAAVGLFTSLNLLLFFIFWDLGVIAMFLMINILGSERRHLASMNFILYELFASSMLLLGIILLYVYLPAHSLNISYLAVSRPASAGNQDCGAYLPLPRLHDQHGDLPNAFLASRCVRGGVYAGLDAAGGHPYESSEDTG